MRGFLLGLAAALLGSGLAATHSVRLEGIRHEYQRLNNCGPATLAMSLSFWGSRLTQYQTAPALKPNRADKNVSPSEMAAYARAQGFGVHQGLAGDLALLKRLLAAGYPVIAQTWFVSDQGGMGHYRLLTGYEESGAYFRAFDSYNGPDIRLGYGELDRLWQVYNRTYLVVYPASRQAAVAGLLGQRLAPGFESQRALGVARQEVQRQPADGFAWFNLGSSLLEAGDAAGAAAAFDRARSAPVNRSFDPDRPPGAGGNWPWRTLWYQFGPYAAYYGTGRYAEVVSLTSQTLGKAPDHEESYYWRARARMALGQTEAARADLRAALRHRPGFAEARSLLSGVASR